MARSFVKALRPQKGVDLPLVTQGAGDRDRPRKSGFDWSRVLLLACVLPALPDGRAIASTGRG